MKSLTKRYDLSAPDRGRALLLSVAIGICIGLAGVVISRVVQGRASCSDLHGQMQNDGVCLLVPDVSN